MCVHREFYPNPKMYVRARESPYYEKTTLSVLIYRTIKLISHFL